MIGIQVIQATIALEDVTILVSTVVFYVESGHSPIHKIRARIEAARILLVGVIDPVVRGTVVLAWQRLVQQPPCLVIDRIVVVGIDPIVPSTAAGGPLLAERLAILRNTL